MAQKTLNAFVVIGGRVDNSFGQIGTALISMGQTIDQISQKLINFGKESVDVFRGYQDSMLDAQVALSTTYGRGTRELASVMKTLDAQATEWAASTIFHTDDVANAIAQAAHANWDLNMILTGIPNAMRLAQAGGMDLSESVDFIIKSVNGAGLEFKDLTDFIDEWTFAANSSAGDVEQFGEAMLKMGNTMQFAGNKEELLTMLAILHDSGQVGASAGTLLRNTMIRLIAPTKKAADAMAELGFYEEDVYEAMSEVDGDTEGAVKRLEELGFSVYDDTGRLKDFMTIFADLGKATEGMSDEERYAIWSAIFPTRTITGGMALINGAKDSVNGLYQALRGGDAEGYGEYAAETMMSGLTGSIETFNSKLERLKQITGEALSDDVTYWTDKLGQFVDGVATMDDANFKGLVGGLKVIAVSGPGLIAAGIGFRFLGFALGTHAGRIALGAVAIAALANAVKEYDEAKFEENFGTMDLDTAALSDQLQSIKQDFYNTTRRITGFRNSLQKAIEKYNEASETFSSKLLSDMLTQKELTEDDLAVYQGYGEQMIGALKQGMKDSADMSAEFWAALFKHKDEEGDEYAKNPMFQGIIKLLREDYDENSAEVEAIGEEMRAAITAAFDNDGKVDEQEYEKLKEYFRQLNEMAARAEAEARSEEEYVKRRMMFDKGQNLSYDAMMDYINENVIPQRQAELDYWQDEYQKNRYKLEYKYQKDYAAAASEEERAAVDQKYNEILGGRFAEGGQISFESLDAELARQQAGVYAAYDQGILDMMSSTLHESDLSQADALIEHLVGNILSGTMTETDARRVLQSSQYAQSKGWTGFGTGFWGLGINTEKSQAGQAADYYSQQIKALGGRSAMEERIKQYIVAGMEEEANALSMILSKTDFYSGVNNAEDNLLRGLSPLAAARSAGLFQDANKVQVPYSPENQEPSPYTIGLDGTAYGSPYVIPMGLDENGEPITQGKASTEGKPWEGVTYFGENPPPQQENTLSLSLDVNGEPVTSTPTQQPYTVPLALNGAGEPVSSTPAPPPYTIPLVIEGADEEAGAARSEAESTLEQPIDASIRFPDALFNASSARSDVESQFATPIMQHVLIKTAGGAGVTVNERMATGGRATEPAIFAEAGKPEWFIPEEHTPGTAALIAQAAEASGFSLAELAVMNGARMFAEGGVLGNSSVGSLSWGEMEDSAAEGADAAGNTYDVHYAPVIHAENAEGVDRVLRDDKKRLKKMLREIEEERALIGSVVNYG